jgi:RepB DNA-primase from phage plasmid
MSDCTFFFTLCAVHQQLAAMPNDFYFIQLIHGSTRKPFPGKRLWNAGQLTHGSVLRFLRARNCQGFDIYLWPYAEHGNAGYILLDLDYTTPGVIARMCANGHEPCVLLRTSPGHLQAWIRVSLTPLEPALATLIGKHLAHIYGGDMASTDWRHLGRLAGFTNQKPQRRTVFGSAPWVGVEHARTVLASAAQQLLRSAERLAQPPTPTISAVSPAVFRGGKPAPKITTEAAVHIYRRWVEHWHIRERFVRPDWSIVDLWLARKLLTMHISPTQVEAIIRLGSPNFPRHHGDPVDYLRRTLARAALPIPTPRTVCSTHVTPAPRTRRQLIDTLCGEPHWPR